jgi:abhydrolase domain-containing protein 17
LREAEKNAGSAGDRPANLLETMEKQRLKKLLLGDFSGKRIIRSMILIPLLVYISLFFFAIFFSDRLIFQSHPSSYNDSEKILKFASKNGAQISATYLPNAKARYTILYSHGNAEDIGDAQPIFEELRDLGFSIFAYDYQGYGTSQGEPSESNAYDDVEAAYNYLTENLGIQSENIIAYGHSLGGAMAIDLAVKKPVAGLIVESSFTTAFRVMTRISIMPFDKFRSIDKIAAVKCPVLVIHGMQDNTIVAEHGKALFERAGEPKKIILVDGVGHVSARLFAPKRFLAAMQELGLMTK